MSCAVLGVARREPPCILAFLEPNIDMSKVSLAGGRIGVSEVDQLFKIFSDFTTSLYMIYLLHIPTNHRVLILYKSRHLLNIKSCNDACNETGKS